MNSNSRTHEKFEPHELENSGQQCHESKESEVMAHGNSSVIHKYPVVALSEGMGQIYQDTQELMNKVIITLKFMHGNYSNRPMLDPLIKY